MQQPHCILFSLDKVKMVDKIPTYLRNAEIAQLVEQGTENPCVRGSIPRLGTILINMELLFIRNILI